MAAARFLSAVWVASLPLASATACSSQKRRFWTTGEPGEQDGFQCLACPTQNVSTYRVSPNNHPAAFTEAENFVLDYWVAMDTGNFSFLMNSYAGSGSLIRAGGPEMWGAYVNNASNPYPFNGTIAYDDQAALGGLIYFFYSTGDGKWNGNGGVFAVANGTGGLHVALQDTVHVSDDFAIITTIINGTQHSRYNGTAFAPWTSMKQSITVRKFGGGIGWKIVHFTCSWYSFAWLGNAGLQCMPGESSGIPPPHVDWSAAEAYSVKFTDPANYCSSRCTCGEAPVVEPPCQGSVASTTQYRTNIYVTDIAGPAQGILCLPCAESNDPRPEFPEGSPEKFALDFVKALGAGNVVADDVYSTHAVIVRNGGPAITGPPSASSLGGNGKEFFTALWPGLTFVGSGGATNELHIAVQRTLFSGSTAQVLLATNGTLYSKATGKVAVPWAAKKLAVTVVREGNKPTPWRVVSLSALDYNANGVSRCTFDGVANNYCLSKCPCGEVTPVSDSVARAENVTYIHVRSFV